MCSATRQVRILDANLELRPLEWEHGHGGTGGRYAGVGCATHFRVSADE